MGDLVDNYIESQFDNAACSTLKAQSQKPKTNEHLAATHLHEELTSIPVNTFGMDGLLTRSQASVPNICAPPQ